MKLIFNLCGLLFAVAIAAAIVGSMNRKPAAPGAAPAPQIAAAPPAAATPSASAPGRPGIGDTACLGYAGGGGHAVWICLQESAWNDMLDAQNAGSLGAMARLAQAGKVKAYPVGTRVKVAGSSLFSRKVIVLDGDDAGDMGWVQTEQVLPSAARAKTAEPPAPSKADPAEPTPPAEDELSPEEKTRKEREQLIEKRRARRARPPR